MCPRLGAYCFRKLLRQRFDGISLGHGHPILKIHRNSLRRAKAHARSEGQFPFHIWAKLFKTRGKRF